LPFTRAVWFNSQWGLRLENLNLNSPSHLIGVFLNPPFDANIEGNKRGEFLLFGAVICEAIWRARNQTIFEGQETNPHELCQKVDKTIVEYRRSMAVHSGFQLPKLVQEWKKHPRDSIKINVDAAFKDGGSSIAIVVRDWRGEVIFACAKRVYTNLPLQAEAEAIKWALSLTKRLETAALIVESDSKDCVDTLAPSCKNAPWRIRGISSEILNLISLIPGCHVS